MATAKEYQETLDIPSSTDVVQYDKCKKHKNQDVKFYCCDHNTCECAECFLDNHQFCKREYVKDVAKRFNKDGHFEGLKQKIRELETMQTEKMRAIDTLTAEADKINKTVIGDVQSCLDLMKTMIENFEGTMFEEAKTRNSENLKKITLLKEDVLKVGEDIECSKYLLDGANHPYKQFILAMETQDKIKALQATLSSIQRRCSIDHYTFLPSEGITDLAQQTTSIGVIRDVPFDQMHVTTSTLDAQRVIENASDEWKDANIKLDSDKGLDNTDHKQTELSADLPHVVDRYQLNVSRKPPVPQKQTSSISEKLQHYAQYGMVSGFYENIHNNDPAPGGNVNPGHQYSQPPPQPTDPHDDQGLSSQQQFNQGGYNNPQALPYPHPVHGYPPNFDPNQQNVQGDQGQGNMPQGHQGYPQGQDYPQGHQGYPQGHPQGQDYPQGHQGYPQGHPQGQGYPQGPPGFQPGQPFFPGNQNYPGQMMYTDPNTGMRFMVPISGYPNQYNQTGPDGRPNVPPRQPRGPPPAYFEQKFGFASENTSEKEASLNTKNDAQRVIEKPQHTVRKQTLNVEQYIPRKKSIFHREKSVSDEETFEEVVKDTIKVYGVTASIRSTVEIYFGNKKRSGGGDIVEIWDDGEEEDVIYVKFVEVEVAERVLEREKHVVKETQLIVEQFIPVKETASKPKNEEEKVVEDDDEEEPILDTVKVSGVDPAKRSTIELYLENARRSGGREYDKIWSDDEEEGVIYIKYKSEEVAKEVASRSHTVQGSELKASLYTPPKPPPCYDNKIIIKGLNETTSQDGLFNFIEANSRFIPEGMDYHETETDVVMVTFSDKPDFDKLEQIFQKFKLEGNTLKIAPVPLSNCIMVSDLPEKITQDTVQFYFENKRRCGGGDVQKVIMNDDDTCLVYFVDYTVIDNVLERKHTLSKQTVIVQRYQECLGRPEGDVKERKLKIPEPVIMKDLHKNKVKYLKNSEKNKNELEKMLKDCHSEVCWHVESEDVVIECTITQSVDGCYRLVKTWNNDVMEVVENYMENIVAEKFDVLQDAWEKVMKKLHEINIANPECLALFIDKKTSLINIVGTKAAVVELKKKIEDILKDVMDEMERQRQKVKEHETKRPRNDWFPRFQTRKK